MNTYMLITDMPSHMPNKRHLCHSVLFWSHCAAGGAGCSLLHAQEGVSQGEALGAWVEGRRDYLHGHFSFCRAATMAWRCFSAGPKIVFHHLLHHLTLVSDIWHWPLEIISQNCPDLMHHQNQSSTLSFSFLACEAARLAAALCLIVLFPEPPAWPKEQNKEPSKDPELPLLQRNKLQWKAALPWPFCSALTLCAPSWPNHILTQLPCTLLFMLISIHIHVTSQSHGMEEVHGALTDGPGCCTAYWWLLMGGTGK